MTNREKALEEVLRTALEAMPRYDNDFGKMKLNDNGCWVEWEYVRAALAQAEPASTEGEQ